MIAWIVAGLALLAARLFNTLRASGAQRRQHALRVFTPEGIVAGAEGFMLRGTNGRGVLLLHGSGDTPQSLRYLADQLHETGFTVHVPLLPGHGRDVGQFRTVTARGYAAAAAEALDTLLRDTPRVCVGGLSMGGALAARLVADRAEPRALLLLAPYLEAPPSVQWAVRTARVWGPVVPFVEGRGDRSVHDPVAAGEGLAYGVFSPAALRAMVITARLGQRALPRVQVPTLVVHSREDNRIPMAIAERSTARLRAHTERHWMTGCGHVITVDYCKAQVAQLVIDFLGRHGA